jgi:hypothetical protein
MFNLGRLGEGQTADVRCGCGQLSKSAAMSVKSCNQQGTNKIKVVGLPRVTRAHEFEKVIIGNARVPKWFCACVARIHE